MSECIVDSRLNNQGYSINWRDIIRPSILKRDKYQCIQCAVSNHTKYTLDNRNRVLLDDQWLLAKYQSLGYKILVTHLNISHTCNNKACINPEHLQCLCQSCHLRYDKHHNLLTRLYNASLNAQKRKGLSQ